MRGLGDLPGGGFTSAALGVSNDGSVVVGFANSAVTQEAFIWDAVHGMRSLGSLPGESPFGIAYAVSGDGKVVGGRTQSSSGTQAFIWDEVHGMREVDQILVGLGVNLAGWQLTDVYAISDDGLAFAGNGRHSGNTEPWYAVIPEPSTSLLLGYGLAGLAIRRRARALWRRCASGGASLAGRARLDCLDSRSRGCASTLGFTLHRDIPPSD